MEKLLYKANCLARSLKYEIDDTVVIQAVSEFYGWVFLGMGFSKNVNGRTFSNPSIALTFSSNICIIPDRLLPSRACFRLYGQGKCNEYYPTAKKIYKKNVRLEKNEYFCKLKLGLKKVVNVYQDLIKK